MKKFIKPLFYIAKAATAVCVSDRETSADVLPRANELVRETGRSCRQRESKQRAGKELVRRRVAMSIMATCGMLRLAETADLAGHYGSASSKTKQGFRLVGK